MMNLRQVGLSFVTTLHQLQEMEMYLTLWLYLHGYDSFILSFIVNVAATVEPCPYTNVQIWGSCPANVWQYALRSQAEVLVWKQMIKSLSMSIYG